MCACEDLRWSVPDSRHPTGGWLPVFFINRTADSDRRRLIEVEIERAGLTGERVSAVEGLTVPDSLRAHFFEADRSTSPLMPGEVGCYASHLSIYQLMVARRLPYALVLEDDAILAPNLLGALRDLFDLLPPEWDVVHLSGDPTRAFKPLSAIGDEGCRLVRYSRIPTGTVGYLISNRGAERFLKPLRRTWPIDTDLRRPWLFGLEVYGVFPRLITHRSSGGKSPISALGGRSRRRRGLRFPSRDGWTGNPLHTSHGFLFNWRTLGSSWWFSCWMQNLRARAIRIFSEPLRQNSRSEKLLN